MYDKFTTNAKRAMQIADEEARNRNSDMIGTDHLLLALLRIEECTAARILYDCGLDLASVRQKLEQLMHTAPHHQRLLGSLPETPRTRSTLQQAIEEARSLECNYVGTEHLLLGLLHDTGNVGTAFLQPFGIVFETMRKIFVQRKNGNVQSVRPIVQNLPYTTLLTIGTRIDGIPADPKQLLLDAIRARLDNVDFRAIMFMGEKQPTPEPQAST